MRKIVTVPSSAKRMHLPKWGSAVDGETGEMTITLSVDGQVVTKGYAAHRSVLFANGDWPSSPLRMVGFGGIKTTRSFRRQGYLGHWYTAALAECQYADVAMIFCLEPLVRRNRELGWTMLTCPVSYDQASGRELMPPHVFAGYRFVSQQPFHGTLSMVQIQGRPW